MPIGVRNSSLAPPSSDRHRDGWSLDKAGRRWRHASQMMSAEEVVVCSATRADGGRVYLRRMSSGAYCEAASSERCALMARGTKLQKTSEVVRCQEEWRRASQLFGEFLQKRRDDFEWRPAVDSAWETYLYNCSTGRENWNHDVPQIKRPSTLPYIHNFYITIKRWPVSMSYSLINVRQMNGFNSNIKQ